MAVSLLASPASRALSSPLLDFNWTAVFPAHVWSTGFMLGSHPSKHCELTLGLSQVSLISSSFLITSSLKPYQ